MERLRIRTGLKIGSFELYSLQQTQCNNLIKFLLNPNNIQNYGIAAKFNEKGELENDFKVTKTKDKKKLKISGGKAILKQKDHVLLVEVPENIIDFPKETQIVVLKAKVSEEGPGIAWCENQDYIIQGENTKFKKTFGGNIISKPYIKIGDQTFRIKTVIDDKKLEVEKDATIDFGKLKTGQKYKVCGEFIHSGSEKASLEIFEHDNYKILFKNVNYKIPPGSAEVKLAKIEIKSAPFEVEIVDLRDTFNNGEFENLLRIGNWVGNQIFVGKLFSLRHKSSKWNFNLEEDISKGKRTRQMLNVEGNIAKSKFQFQMDPNEINFVGKVEENQRSSISLMQKYFGVSLDCDTFNYEVGLFFRTDEKNGVRVYMKPKFSNLFIRFTEDGEKHERIKLGKTSEFETLKIKELTIDRPSNNSADMYFNNKESKWKAGAGGTGYYIYHHSDDDSNNKAGFALEIDRQHNMWIPKRIDIKGVPRNGSVINSSRQYFYENSGARVYSIVNKNNSLQFIVSGEKNSFNENTLCMTITEGARVGIGTTAPEAILHVNGKIKCIGPVDTTSDVCYKTNITTLSQSLQRLIKLRGVKFNWKINEYPDMNFDHKIQFGVIAQEVEKVLPEMVHTNTKGNKTLAYSSFIALLIEAIKEQQTQIQQIQNKMK